MLYLIGFLLVIGIAVNFHEWGHYLAARCFRVRVLRYSIGIGSPLRILGREMRWTDKRGTEWVVAPFLVAAYVQMLDVRESGRKGLPLTECLDARPPWQRFIVYGAGPLANFVLAALIYTSLHMVGETQTRPVVGKVFPDTPAAAAGLLPGDEIALVNNYPANQWRAVWARFVDAIAEGEAVDIRTANGGQRTIPAGALTLDDLQLGLSRGVGITQDFSYYTAEIGRVMPGTPAERAGLRAGDFVVMANDTEVNEFMDLLGEVSTAPNLRLSLIVWRDAEESGEEPDGVGFERLLVAELEQREDGRGFLGVLPMQDMEKFRSLQFVERHGFADAFRLAVVRMWDDVKRAFNFLRLIATFQIGLDHMSGPVGIAKMAGDALERGLEWFIRLLAVLSVSLGAINLVPVFQIFDGWHMAACVVESIRGRPLSERTQVRLQQIGVTLVVALLVFLTINDILKW